MTQPPPITPGEDPYPQYVPPVSAPPQQPPVVYMQQQPTGDPTTVVGKTALGTVTVIITLVAVFCVLPMIGCGILAAIGYFAGPPPAN